MGDFFVIMKTELRIKSPLEFQEVINKRRFRNSNAFTIYYVPKRKDHSRFGITASKKMGNAVLRNKTRRQVRMMLQEIQLNDLKFDAVILVRKKYFEQSYEDNRLDLEKVLKTVKI